MLYEVITQIFFILLLSLHLTSCDDYLDVPSYGTLTEDNLAGAKQIENEVISAYAAIGNDEINRPLSLWNYGNVRSDDAYKGGNDQNDGDFLHFLEISRITSYNVCYTKLLRLFF